MSVFPIPKSKVVCVLCRGFVGYKHGDKSRFEAHMKEEHEVWYDTDVILAVSVITLEERNALIKAAQSRLQKIGEGHQYIEQDGSHQGLKLINSGKSSAVVTKEAVKFEIPESMQEAQDLDRVRGNNRGVNSSKGRGRSSYSGSMSPTGGETKLQVKTVMVAPPPPLVMTPLPQLQGNHSINISVVDQTSICSQCQLKFANRDAMGDHVKLVHLNKFAGLSVATSKDAKEKCSNIPDDSTSQVKETPQEVSRVRLTSVQSGTRNIPSGVRLSRSVRQDRSMSPSLVPTQLALTMEGASPISPERTTSVSVPSDAPVTKMESGTKSDSQPTSRLTQQLNTVSSQPEPVARSNRASRTKSVSKRNSMSRAHIENKVSSVSASMCESAPAQLAITGPVSPPSLASKDDQMIKCDVCEKSFICSVYVAHEQTHVEEDTAARLLLGGDVSNTKLETTNNTDSLSCKECGELFPSNITLMRHVNKNHSENNINTEILLVEDNDDVRENKIKEELDGMETMELLDNLVNYLND